MPITYNQEEGKWEITNITPEEASSLLQIGKEAIVNGLGKELYSNRAKDILLKVKEEEFFQA